MAYACPRCASLNTRITTGYHVKKGPSMKLHRRNCTNCEQNYYTIEAVFKNSLDEDENHKRIYEILNNHFIENVRNPNANWPKNTYDHDYNSQ